METQDDESPQARQFKAEQRRQRIYEIILRMVLWDEKEEDVFKKLEVNGFTGEKAQEMYREARRERVAAIRGDCWRPAGLGLLVLALSVGVFCQFWFGFGFIPRLLIGGCAVGTFFGGWKLVGGLVGLVTASTKQGSLAEDG
jgi:hypothetical protein